MTTTVDESMRNGVDTTTLFATIDAVKAAPEAAKFQFRAHNEWLSGTHNRGTINDYFGVGAERTHERSFTFDADHPAVLVGRDNGPTPTEFVLHALRRIRKSGEELQGSREVRDGLRIRRPLHRLLPSQVEVLHRLLGVATAAVMMR